MKFGYSIKQNMKILLLGNHTQIVVEMLIPDLSIKNKTKNTFG